jgi:hypothetical protein
MRDSWASPEDTSLEFLPGWRLALLGFASSHQNRLYDSEGIKANFSPNQGL